MSGAASLGPGGFLRALRVQGRVTMALIMRELHTRYGRDNIGYLWLILEPLLLASAVAVLHGAGGSHGTPEIHPVPFGILGYCVFIIFRGIFGRAEGVLESNRPLLYHRQVTILDMMVSRTLLEGAGCGATLALLLGMAHLFDFATLPYRPLYLIGAVFLMTWFSFGAGMICCAITHDNRLVARLVHPATYLAMPISGAFYMVDWIPAPYRELVLYIPTLHIFEMARYGQFEACKDTYIDYTYMLGTCLVLTIVGMLAIRIIRRHVHLN